MKGPGRLLEREDNWNARMGLVFAGQRVVIRGKDLFNELADMRWMEMFLFAITGKQFTDQQIRLFEGMWSLCTNYPDPRIWNNRIASLAGTARSTCTLALAAATSVSEATIYGRRPDIRSIDFLIRAKEQLDAGYTLESVVQQELHEFRGIAGYGRPMATSDERIEPLLNRAREVDLDQGPHTALAFEIQQFLQDHRYRMNMNVAALGAGLAADQGLTSYEYYLFLNPAFTGGIIPCFIDSVTQEEGTFLPIPCNRLIYKGKENRRWE